MKINFKEIKVYNLDGTEITGVNIHELVANAVYKQASASPIKNVELARKIYADGEIELSADEISIVSNAVTTTATFGDFIKEAILKALE